MLIRVLGRELDHGLRRVHRLSLRGTALDLGVRGHLRGTLNLGVLGGVLGAVGAGAEGVRWHHVLLELLHLSLSLSALEFGGNLLQKPSHAAVTALEAALILIVAVHPIAEHLDSIESRARHHSCFE